MPPLSREWERLPPITEEGLIQMTDQPNNLPSLEADLLGATLRFHRKTMTLLRQSSLDDEKMKVVAERIKTLLETATDEVKR